MSVFGFNYNEMSRIVEDLLTVNEIDRNKLATYDHTVPEENLVGWDILQRINRRDAIITRLQKKMDG